MDPLDVTIAVVPRERFSLTERSLENLYAQTTAPFTLVYLSAGAPRFVQRYLDEASKRHGFRLIITNQYASPNQARNLVMREVSTKYVVFLDNDALVTPQWLEKLVRCAEDTGAWIVGPLYLIGEPEQKTIHMAGGNLHFAERDGQRIGYDEHRLGDANLSALTEPLLRQTCDFVEFHCMLLRTDLFDRLGPLDERLLSVQEHIDVGWAARQAGGSVYLEPSAVVSYVPPPPFEWSDLPYFMLRWSDEWTKASVDHFNQKWGLSTMRHFGDERSSLEFEDTVVRFARAHRRLTTGMRIPGVWDGEAESAVEQARLMVGLMLSVDRDGFDLLLTTAEDEEVEETLDLKPERILACLPGVIEKADLNRLQILIRPRPRRRPGYSALVRADLNLEELTTVEPYGFLTTKTGPDWYQVWLAVDTSHSRSASILRRLGASAGPGAFSPLAGSPTLAADQPASGSPRILLHGGVAGAVTTGMDLEGGGVLSHLWSCEVYW